MCGAMGWGDSKMETLISALSQKQAPRMGEELKLL